MRRDALHCQHDETAGRDRLRRPGDGLQNFIGVVAGVALVLSAWLLVILWTAPNEDGGAPSTSVVYPPDPPQPGEPLDRQAVGRAGELGINLVSAGQEKREL
jgi:hypothetical protein